MNHWNKISITDYQGKGLPFRPLVSLTIGLNSLELSSQHFSPLDSNKAKDRVS